MPRRLSDQDVAKVAELARLRLSEAEQERFAEQLGQVLEYVEILNRVDTAQVEPLAHPLEIANVFREDRLADSLPRQEALKNAPATDGECFRVPAILGER